MLSICVAAALLALCRGQNTEHEGNSLSASGYRLCTYNETRNVSLLVMHAAPYTVTKPCGGWLHWKTCTVTLYRMTHETETRTVKQQVTRCCPGHVQVGRYCALPVNRSDEFTAKPGSCPTADGVQNRSGGCEWDIDCPGWHKCCQSSSRYVCSDPANSTYYSDNGGYRLNATVTVKTDYQPLMSTDRGLLDHTRLLQAMVTGALQSDVTVYYLSSQPVHPFRTATSILIACNLTLSLHAVTSELHLLLKHIQEVSSVTVEDVDECALSALRGCSPHSDCNNTVGSYLCSCHQGYVDVDASNPGAHCTAGVSVETTPEPCLASVPPMNTTTVSASSSTQEHVRNITEGSFSSTGTSMPTAQSNTSTVAYNSSNAPQWTSSYSSLRSTVEPPLPTTTCYPANITSVWAADVTGTSFRVHWSSQFQTNQTYQVDLSKRSEVIHSGVTSQTMMEMRDLQPGVLYTVAVTPSSCQQGITVDISVKTDAQKLEATTRLTNIEFSADLQNGSSQAYQNLTESITQEIYQSLSPEMKAMVDSGQMRIEITSFSQGSVFVHFTMTLAPSESQDIANVSTALQSSLLNSTKYTVDKNNTSTHDFNECTMGENDCSLLATCTNTWASYTCVCLDGFIDNNPERPGRACHAPPSTATTLRTAPSASTLGEISVQCRVASITVTVSRAFLLSNNIRESSLYLGLPECGVNGGNALHAQLTVAWDECGTSLVHNETYYMASVPLFNTMDMYTSDSGTVEAPKIQLEVPIMCSYMKSMLISADFGSMGYDMIKDLTITGSGEFQVTVQLMNGTMPLPHNYSLSSEEAVVVEVSLNTSSQQIKVVINKCWATPTLHPVDIPSHIFLENSCSMNAYTTVLMNGNSSTSRVSAQIFSFIDLDVIYLHCQVQICVQTGSGSCVPDCQQRTAQSPNTIGTAFGSSGPLLRSNEESMEEESDTLHLVGLSCLGIGVSLFFIMGFVCLFYYQRNRIGHYNFSAKPKQENFTYLVFNT
ncbi:hypothetical protein CesoFtcFv8_016758 [Champsocephalus esox]|uniref:Uromodulin-like 1 n=1 Tax=Champsocephalus esox TaxID=159716 RepID=A0AAN8BNV2_9TELE|nr:hypothetical protein CesoFtcFv8_016758 [Champsocephalus esox]